ncbi:MAG: hypothetical protein BGO69_10775 [Bacteroidetes bacterium 46-16]|mgnify:CR=1 FL=1|nr:MAG: hypothetical protein BGO69_10775 [Bacteroidetes bacterium 46-16]
MFQGNTLLNPITGVELNSLFNNVDFVQSIYTTRVSPDPSLAVERIARFYGVKPSVSGDNVSDMITIREKLVEIASDASILYAFALTAPHTHWPVGKPVIYSFISNKDCYHIGHLTIKEDCFYTPTSFVFSEDGPIPYEWADETIVIDKHELQQCYEIVHAINSNLLIKELPIGIAIDFRFRNSLKKWPQRSLEFPSSNPSHSVIQRGLVENNVNLNTSMEQVSWHALSELLYSFSEPEKLLLTELSALVEKANGVIEKEAIISNLVDAILSEKE